jgi:hypothetical protein
LSWSTLQQFSERAAEAFEAETFDARVDRHLSWSLLRLDEPGWKKLMALLDGYFESQFAMQRAAKKRLHESPHLESMVATFFLTGFEAAPCRRHRTDL